MKVSVLFDNIGPYHAARLSVLAGLCDLQAIELRKHSSEYSWDSPVDVGFERTTLVDTQDDVANVREALCHTLDQTQPDAVFIPGWSSRFSLSALLWAREARTRAFLMSDSQEIDFERSAYKEWIKRRIVENFSGALVAGAPHKAYVEALGMRLDAVRLGYDVVDNAYFARGVATARAFATDRRAEYGLPVRYFLAVARLVEKKNLPFLLDAFVSYRRIIGRDHADVSPWDLVLVGDGPMRGVLEQQLEGTGYAGCVHMPGFVQYPELPVYYGLAGAFIHASSTEQWGLVVNEAMASSLPVLVSGRCGCALDLVAEGENGFTFNPAVRDDLVRLMLDMSLRPSESRDRMGETSLQRIEAFSPETFAHNALDLASCARGESRPLTLAAKLMLRGLIGVRKHG